MTRASLIVVPFLAGVVAVACGEPAKTVDPKFAEVAAIHKGKCGRCHKRVEPGKRPRDHLEDAFKTHRKRVPMSDENWALMVDYLAAPTTPNPG